MESNMFSKILIANRGEIACRIIATAKKMGVHTVAVYSDIDRNALHVQLADTAVYIGASVASESYLCIDRIVAAAVQTGAQAIHPGYGFLSENPSFVEACSEADIVFIGPSAEAIRAMGLKDAAKQRMVTFNVPVVPGYHGANQDESFLAIEAEKIGYPVLLKARAGGGGKGMRKVDDPSNFAELLVSAKREALASFADDSVLIEKYIQTPRHIEVQVFGDNYGNVIHLFERDCSAQRRHQKVIEEAPAPGMTDIMRNAMGNAAVQAAKAVRYSGAGTVEFIVDASNGLREDRFWFMEMNTRLQVEHPVTEAITGVDLVEWQLRIAAGEPLPLDQAALSITGHAFEARIYAEDADKDFMPATGCLDYLSLPHNLARIDTGVQQGDEVSAFYDPMIAKVTVHAADRDSALHGLRLALADTHIAGCIANSGFLLRLVNLESFSVGGFDTSLIEQYASQLHRSSLIPIEVKIAAGLVVSGLLNFNGSPEPWDSPVSWRHFENARLPITLANDEQEFGVGVVAVNSVYILDIDNDFFTIRVVSYSAYSVSLEFPDGRRLPFGFVLSTDGITIFYDNDTWRFHFPLINFTMSGETSGDGALQSPMPGRIVDVMVDEGDLVEQGDRMIVLEAMKMEHTITAPFCGIVKRILVQIADQVEVGELLVSIESTDE